MLFEITYIDKQGEIESFRCTICGEKFESMIHVMKFRRKKTFIYDNTVTQSDIFQQESSFSQRSTHSSGANTFHLQNFSQIQFGRRANVNIPLNI